MTDEGTDIQFGNIEQSSPATAVRPDQDAHFAIRTIGTPAERDMPVFVDLDVMRDMEAHSVSNTRVELGGVMLGRQYTDSDGQPYVVVSESLRASHYKATRGSFKFTHDTWSQITRDRKKFHPDLEMVGWYHTHPGWTVFLSPLDLFICDNFFNGPQNVALVIDPCNDDRGWFQWNQPGDQPANRATDSTNQTPPRRTGGFFLFTNRHCTASLDYFAAVYNKDPEMNVDPRYASDSPSAIVPSAGHGQRVLMVDPHARKSDNVLWLVTGLQLALILFLVWKMLAPDFGNRALVSLPDGQMISVAELRASNQIYRDVLNTVVTDPEGAAGLADQYMQLQVEQTRLTANLDGQIARVDALLTQKETLQSQSAALKRDNQALESLAVENGQQIQALQDHNQRLLAGRPGDVVSSSGLLKTALITCGGVVAGLLAGFFAARWLPFVQADSGSAASAQHGTARAAP